MKDRVIHWLETGANASEGVRLINEACAPSVVLKLISKDPDKNIRFIKNWLCYHFSVDAKKVIKNPDVDSDGKKPRAFRDEFPFLNSPDCPQELEALASRKFAKYHKYVDLHAKLKDCTSLSDCAHVSREILNNYFENRLIWDELNYYKEHGSCLGRHPIFTAFRRRKEVLAMNIKDLMLRKRQVENNIWRVKSELKKGDKPHLEVERKSRLFTYEQELAEINRLLGNE